MSTAVAGEDLRRLPLRALLAFAARCARRVVPRYGALQHPQAPQGAAALEQALALIDALAQGEDPDPEQLAIGEEAAVQALLLASDDEHGEPSAALAANAVYAAINAARAAAEAAHTDEPSLAEGVIESVAAARDAAVAADPGVERGARLDWDILNRLKLGQFPELGDPVNPSPQGMLGPLVRETRPLAPRAAPRDRTTPRDDPAPERTPGEAHGAETRSEADNTPHATRSKKVRVWLDRIKAREQEVADERRRVESERAAVDLAFAQLRTLEERITAQQEAFLRERHEHDDEVRKLAAELAQARAELDEQRTRQGELAARLAGGRERLEAAEAALGEDRAQFEAERQRWMEQTTARTLEVASQEAERVRQAELQRALDEREQQLADRERKLVLDQQRIATRKEQVAAAVKRWEAAEEQRKSQLADLEARYRHQELDRAALERTRHELEQESAAIRDRAAEVHADAEALEERRARFQQELAEARASLPTEADTAAAAERQALWQAEQARLQALSDELQNEQQRHREAAAALDQERERLQRDQQALAEQARALQAAQLTVEKDRKENDRRQQELKSSLVTFRAEVDAFEEAQRKIERDGVLLQEQRDSLDRERHVLEHQVQSFREAQEQARAERARVERLRAEAESRARQVELERTQLEQTLLTLEHRSVESANRSSQVAEREAELNLREGELRLLDEQLRIAGEVIQSERENLDAERLALLEEKAQLARREADLQRQVHADRRKGDGSGSTREQLLEAQRQATELREKLEHLEHEHASIEAERERLAKELLQFRESPSLSAARPQPQPPRELRRAVSAPRPLRLLLDAGEAGSDALGELFGTLVRMARQLGAPDVYMTVSQCRLRNAAEGERTVAELLLLPRPGRDGVFLEQHAGPWEQFRCCLCMALPLDTGLTSQFEDGDVVSRQHPLRRRLADAVRSAANHHAAGCLPGAAGLPIDTVNRELQALERLLRRLQAESGLMLELAPLTSRISEDAVEHWNRLSRVTNHRGVKTGRVAILILLFGLAVMFAAAPWNW